MGRTMDRVCQSPGIRRDDILAAMKSLPGYLDISLDDFAQIYQAAFEHALKRVRRGLTAAQIMTRRVTTVQVSDPAALAAERMAASAVGGLPVLDRERRVAGVISERDLLRALSPGNEGGFMALVAACLSRPDCQAASLRRKTVADLMSSPAILVAPGENAEAMADLMAARRINRLPVTEQGGQLVGMVSRGDLLAALGQGGGL